MQRLAPVPKVARNSLRTQFPTIFIWSRPVSPVAMAYMAHPPAPSDSLTPT